MSEDDILDGGNDIAAAIIFAGRAIAREIRNLGNGDAATPMGALEAFGDHIGKKLDALTEAIGFLSDE
jgi:nucleoside-diphosphate-sugar epimerase